MRRTWILTLLALTVAAGTAARGETMQATADQLAAAATGDHRPETHVQRNRYRHPVETLSFFGLEPDMTVLEIWPGRGWYTEVLAPVLRDHGQLIVASYDPDVPDQPDYRYELHQALQEKFAADPEIYDRVEIVEFSPPQSGSLGPAESVDMVLTFRNAHGWVNAGLAEAIFEEFARVLKPGGVLGIVQHRAEQGADPEESVQRGYVPEATIIELAENAGLVLDGRSEINANPKDTRDHPEGVWTLPPSLRLGEQDREKYLAIGESDRMTLRFVKPKPIARED